MPLQCRRMHLVSINAYVCVQLIYTYTYIYDFFKLRSAQTLVYCKLSAAPRAHGQDDDFTDLISSAEKCIVDYNQAADACRAFQDNVFNALTVTHHVFHMSYIYTYSNLASCRGSRPRANSRPEDSSPRREEVSPELGMRLYHATAMVRYDRLTLNALRAMSPRINWEWFCTWWFKKLLALIICWLRDMKYTLCLVHEKYVVFTFCVARGLGLTIMRLLHDRLYFWKQS